MSYICPMDAQIRDKSSAKQMPAMDRPARYRLTIVGNLDTAWSSRLSGMTITITGGRGRKTITSLEGRLADQSALTGVITTLNDLQYPILSVEYLDNDQS